MSAARVLSTSLILLAALFPGLAAAHPSGVSRVDLIIRQDTLEALVDVNQSDLFYVLGFPTLSSTPKSEYAAMADRIAYYYQTRLQVKIDGRIRDMKILQFKKHGGDPALKMDSTDLADTTIVLRLGWAIPPGSRRLDLESRLFAELELQSICHLRLEYQGKEIKRKFMGVDDRFTLSLQPDSLQAYLTALEKHAQGAGGVSQAADDEESVIGRFIWLGFTHILPKGADHILFVLGLFFFSTLLRPLLIQVTAFTIAHSITLGLSLLGVFSLPASIVEPLIALSITVVAVENIFFRKLRPSRFLIVFGFGLIHGLGFAGVLKSLGLPEGQFFEVLLSFNVGVELGQLTVIAGACALTVWMWKKPWYFRRVVVPVSSLIAAVGLFWFIQRLMQLSG